VRRPERTALAAESPLATLRKITGVEQSGQWSRSLLDFIGGGGRSIGLAVLPNKPFAADGPGTVFVECTFDGNWSGWCAGCEIGETFAGEVVSGVKFSVGRVAIGPPLKRGVRARDTKDVSVKHHTFPEKNLKKCRISLTKTAKKLIRF